MIHLNVWRCVSILVLCAIPVALLFGQTTPTRTPEQAESTEVGAKQISAIRTYDATYESRKIRVTVLGITKGIAFLDSQDLIADGDRPHGSSAVPWLRINVMVERLTDDDFGLVGFEIQTADGQDLVRETDVQTGGYAISGRATGTAQMDMNYEQLTSVLFPVAPPEVSNPRRSTIFAFTVSGHIRKTEKGCLILRFGEGKQREEVLFKDIPIP